MQILMQPLIMTANKKGQVNSPAPVTLLQALPGTRAPDGLLVEGNHFFKPNRFDFVSITG